jgi:hypothetical protein
MVWLTIRDERRRKLRPSISLLAGAAIVGALVILPVFHAPLARAQSGECSSFPGYEQIRAGYTKMYVDSQGPAKPVALEPVGSCYKPTPVPNDTINGVQVYTYYNQDDRCLYWNASANEVYTATNSNGCSAQANEEFVGQEYDSGVGWFWFNIEAGVSSNATAIVGYPCTNGGNLTITANSAGDCDVWNFPSDGG